MFAGFRACWCLKANYRLDRFGPCTACPGKGVECSDDKLNLLRGFYWNWADHDGNYSKSTYKLLIANLAIRNDKYNAQTTRFVGKLPVAYKCLRESSCIGGIDSQCAESYTGPLCANCRRGYLLQESDIPSQVSITRAHCDPVWSAGLKYPYPCLGNC